MKNLWKYASYNQRERANMIKNGNKDVYNTEKAINKILRDTSSALGLSTAKVDAWDEYIDTLSTSSKRSSLPKFMTGKESEITNAYNSQARALKSDYDKKVSDTVEDAENSIEYLSELLINNGYSNEGSTYRKTTEKVEKELKQELASLAREYSEKIKSVRARYLSML